MRHRRDEYADPHSIDPVALDGPEHGLLDLLVLEQVLDALGSLETGPGTATADGIRTSLAAIAGLPKVDSGEKAPTAIVLMSDARFFGIVGSG